MRIVCMGDSLTFGYGVDKESNWISLLSKMKDYELINKGIPGNTTAEMLERFRTDVIALRPSAVLILGGTNDVFLKTDINKILNNLTTMINICKINHVTPILLTPLPINDAIFKKTWFTDVDYKMVNQKLIDLRNLLIDYCHRDHIELIDLGNILMNQLDLTDYFLEDGIHLSPLIHKEIANIIFCGLKQRHLDGLR